MLKAKAIFLENYIIHAIVLIAHMYNYEFIFNLNSHKLNLFLFLL